MLCSEMLGILLINLMYSLACVAGLVALHDLRAQGMRLGLN